MHEVVLIEDACCHAGELDGLREFLATRLEGRAEVSKYGVGGPLGFTAVPPDLVKALLVQGAKAVPVVAVDGKLLFSGELPSPKSSLEAIESQLAAEAVERPTRS